MPDNTLTALATTFFSGIQAARRQANGFIPAVTADFDTKGATLNEDVPVIINSAAANTDATASATTPDGDASTPTSANVRLTKFRANRFKVKAEDVPVINRVGYQAWVASKMQLSMLALLDEIDSDIAALYSNATYGIGTPGTLPFASDFKQMATLKRLAVEAGSPEQDLQLVLSPLAAQNLRSNQQLNKANESGQGGESLLRQGILGDINGFLIRESKNIATHVIGAGSGYVTNGVQAKGSTSVIVQTGTGALVKGDWLTFAADTDQAYIANAYAGGAGTLTIRGGLKKSIPTSNAMTKGAAYGANLAFHRRAIALAIRPPAAIPGGDNANETMDVADPVTGLTFQIARYGQYLQATYETRVLWGAGVIEPELLWILAQ
jgi:hypothetical protein